MKRVVIIEDLDTPIEIKEIGGEQDGRDSGKSADTVDKKQ